MYLYSESYYESHIIDHPGGVLSVAVNADGSSNSFQTYGTLEDAFLALYSTPFDPASPCTNYINADGADGTEYDAVMFFALLPAGTYVAVVAGHDFPELGTYQLSYTSFQAPEGLTIPSVNQWGLMVFFMLLAGCVFWLMRRKVIQ